MEAPQLREIPEYVKGKYIAFLDSDDEWLPEKLEKQLLVFEEGPKELGLVYCGRKIFSLSGKTKTSLPLDRDNKKIVCSQAISLATLQSFS